MHEALLQSLRRHRSFLRSRWESLLRAEPVYTPLANPDVLVLMMDTTLTEVEAGLRSLPGRRLTANRPKSCSIHAACPCGLNPLLAYFETAERALDETLSVIPAPRLESEPAIFAREAFVANVKRAFKAVKHREIATFCAVCQQGKDMKKADARSAFSVTT